MKLKLPPHIRWPLFIAGALTLQVASSMVTIYLATSNPSYAVEDDYYQKGLRWDETRAQQQRNRQLGWRLEYAVTPPTAAGDQAVLTTIVRGPGGEPIADAGVSVEAFHNARAREIFKGQLTSGDHGTYEASLPMRRTGLWEFRFTVTRKTEKFTHTETRHIVLD
jgi:hypothetical protein